MIRLRRPVAVVAIIVASLAACRVGPNYRAPALPSGAEAPLVSLNTSAETPTPPPDVWWRLYDDSRLDALVQEALGANRTLAAADANFAAARAVVSEEQVNRYPSTAAFAGGLYGRDAVTDEILELGLYIARRRFGCSKTSFKPRTRSIYSVASTVRSKWRMPTRSRWPRPAMA